MAFDLKIFKTRTITAIIFAAVMLAGVLINHWTFLILFSIIHFGCWWEYLKLIEKIHRVSLHRNALLGFLLMGYAVMLWFCGPHYQISQYMLKDNFSFLVALAGFIMLAAGIFQTRHITAKAFVAAACGFIYISLSWGLMMDLYKNKDFHVQDTRYILPAYGIPLFLILVIWVNDTLAYIVGSLMGKTPLSKTSPKKTVEGTLGGLFLAIAVAGVIGWQMDLPFALVAIPAAIIAIAGIFGDLFESKLKRLATVKDSGRILPGHGGFLDRFDSILFAVPALWVFLFFITK